VTTPDPAPRPRSLNRQIAALAVPALGALLAEPVFLLIDAAIVGHLGTAQLAGVGIASVVLGTTIGLAVFLAYGTTSMVARSLGAGDLRSATAAGMDGIYLALLIGVAVILVGLPTAGPIVDLLAGGSGGSPAEGAGLIADAVGFGTTYLLISLAGIPAMLVVLATNGVLRGLQDTRTPLWVAVAGAVLNTVLNLLFVNGFHWGVAGSAIGTVITQNLMAATLAALVIVNARRQGASLRPHLRGIGTSGRTGLPLLLRTVWLRLAILLTTVVAARLGLAALAAHQVVMSIWNFLALGLDAIAIAAQALTGKALGAGDATLARSLTRAMLRWGIVAGTVIGAVLLAGHAVVGGGFSADPAVRAAIAAALVVTSIAQPLSGFVFVLDGVLIGAGDGWYLAWTGLLNLVAYLPALLAVVVFAPGGATGLGWLWVAFGGVYMAARAVTLYLRYRGDRWLVVGA